MCLHRRHRPQGNFGADLKRMGSILADCVTQVKGIQVKGGDGGDGWSVLFVLFWMLMMMMMKNKEDEDKDEYVTGQS